jgi:hypothetical protein
MIVCVKTSVAEDRDIVCEEWTAERERALVSAGKEKKIDPTDVYSYPLRMAVDIHSSSASCKGNPGPPVRLRITGRRTRPCKAPAIMRENHIRK